MAEDKVAHRRDERTWTRIDTYLVGLARRRSALRRRLKPQPRSETDTPHLLLSTVPFAALLAMLGVLAVAIAVTAWPPAQPRLEQRDVPRELGKAPSGWFKEAQKEFTAPQRS